MHLKVLALTSLVALVNKYANECVLSADNLHLCQPELNNADSENHFFILHMKLTKNKIQIHLCSNSYQELIYWSKEVQDFRYFLSSRG